MHRRGMGLDVTTDLYWDEWIMHNDYRCTECGVRFKSDGNRIENLTFTDNGFGYCHSCGKTVCHVPAERSVKR